MNRTKYLLVALFFPAASAFAGLVTVVIPKKVISRPVNEIVNAIKNLDARVNMLESRRPYKISEKTQSDRVAIKEEYVNFTPRERAQIIRNFIAQENNTVNSLPVPVLAPAVHSDKLVDYSSLYSYIDNGETQ